MSKSDKRSIISYLKVAMLHIIKWYSQPDKRSASWINSIDNSRQAISEIRKDNPSIPDSLLLNSWDKKFNEAKKDAEREMNQKSTVDKLTLEQVFNTKYILTLIFIIGLLWFFW